MLRPYLKGKHLTVQTDHDSMKRILSLMDATTRSACWRLRLSKSGFDGLYCAGIKHQAASALSRLTATRDDQATIGDNLPVAALKTLLQNKPNIFLVTDRPTPSDKADKWEVAQDAEDDDAEKDGAAPTKQTILLHEAINTTCKQVAEKVGQADAEYTIDETN